jgi:hypothetical protein
VSIHAHMFEISPGGTKVMHDHEILAMIYCRVSDLTRPVRIRSACMNAGVFVALDTAWFYETYC